MYFPFKHSFRGISQILTFTLLFIQFKHILVYFFDPCVIQKYVIYLIAKYLEFSIDVPVVLI